MSNKNNSSVVKLIGNKLFISLLVFAIVIILFSAIFNSRVTELADTKTVEKKEEQISVISDADNQSKPEVTPELEETFLPVDEVPAEAERKPLVYQMPIEGQLQKEYSDEDLLWDDTMQDWRTHCGVDIASEQGREVITAASGVVEEAKLDEMYGCVVKVNHGNGVITVYKNLEKMVVKAGDTVDQGQMIGTVGDAGAFELAQKPHIHFEVICDGEYIDPLEFIPQQ